MPQSKLGVPQRSAVGLDEPGRWDPVLRRRGQALLRFLPKPSFAGRGLVERLRTTAFALLGLTTAVALGLVMLVSQQSWPYLPVGPIPAYQAEHGRLDRAISLTPALAELGIPSSDAPVRTARTGAGSGAETARESRVSGSRRVTPPSIAPDPAPDHPDGASVPVAIPGPAPTGQPPVPPPPPVAAAPTAPLPTVPTPAPTTPSPAPVAAANSGKGHAYGREKAAAAPPPKPSHPAPPIATVPAAEPEAPPPAEPPAPVTGPPADLSNGHGHAYGHDR